MVKGKGHSSFRLKPRFRVTRNAEEVRPKANWQNFDFGRSKQLFHTSQIGPPFRAFYWVTTVSSAKRVSGWPRGRNLGGVTGELRRLGLRSCRLPPVGPEAPDLELCLLAFAIGSGAHALVHVARSGADPHVGYMVYRQ